MKVKNFAEVVLRTSVEVNFLAESITAITLYLSKQTSSDKGYSLKPISV